MSKKKRNRDASESTMMRAGNKEQNGKSIYGRPGYRNGKSYTRVTGQAMTNAVNKPSKGAFGMKSQLDPEWFVQYPTIADIKVSTFVPYSSLNTVLRSSAWYPVHVMSQRIAICAGAKSEARQLAINELFNDLKATLRSTLPFTRNDLAAYFEWAIFARIVAKSAEAYFRIGLTAQAEDPNFAASLAAAKFGFTSVEGFLNDYTTFAASLRLRLDTFATWMIEHVRIHCTKISIIDYMMNCGFLEEDGIDSAPLDVFSVYASVTSSDSTVGRLTFDESSITSAAQIIALMNKIEGVAWSETFSIITSSIQNAYGDRLNQAWDFDLKNYVFNSVYDPDIKQQLKNADPPAGHILGFANDAWNSIQLNYNIEDIYVNNYNQYYDAQERMVLNATVPKPVTAIHYPTRHGTTGVIDATIYTPEVDGFAYPYQYLITVDRQALSAGESIEFTKHVQPFTIHWSDPASVGQDNFSVEMDNGCFIMLSTSSVYVANGTLTVNRILGNDVFTQTNLQFAELSLLTYVSTWNEATPLTSVMVSTSQGYHRFGCNAFDSATVVPATYLDNMKYAETASIYRSVISAVS